MTSTPRVVSLVEDYLDAQYTVLVRGERSVREGRLDQVHPTRVASRRYRTVLRDLKDLFDPTTALVLEESLRWYAAQLGRVRDLQVGRRQIEDALAQLAPEEVIGPVAEVVDGFLSARERDAAQAVVTALDSHRYQVMIGQLHQWHARLPLREDPPRVEVTHYLKRARRRYERRLEAADDSAGTVELLHDARKAAKRARYVAELAEPEVGGKARATVRRMTSVQDQLGDQQDHSVSRALLLELMAEGLPPRDPGVGASAPVRPELDGVLFTLGVLHARLSSTP